MPSARRKMPGEYVIVGGHYDHVGSCFSPGDTICNGATDNAAGAAAVVAIGRALRQALVQNIQTQVGVIVADGPAAFDSADVTTLLLATLDLVNVLTRVPCQRF